MNYAKANFVNIETVDSSSMPDNCALGIGARRPSQDFVVSRAKDGSVLSKYADEIWDFRPYRLSGNTGNAKFHFKYFSGNIKEEVKWLIFLLLFVVEPQKASSISISTVMSYYKAIKKLAFFCLDNGETIKSVLQNEEKLTSFVKTITARNNLTGLSSVLSHLLKIDPKLSGYKIISTAKYDIVRPKLHSLKDDEQHPVIPTRILSNLIQDIDNHTCELYDLADPFFAFLAEVVRCEQFARSVSMQQKLGYGKAQFKPLFREAAEEYGLWEFFLKNKISNLPQLSSYMTRIQHGCRLMVHIYSGMRSSEALSLKVGALKAVVNGNQKTYVLRGDTSKFIGQKKKVSWVTSSEVTKAYEIAERFAIVVSKHLDIPLCDTPLFINLSYLSLFNNSSFDGVSLNVASASNKANEFYKLLDEKRYQINEEDIDALERINPFRAWQTERAFSIGSVWRFTIHQFRRSLAFYVAQSALVSLPSLKRQLKHVTREMSVYYCQSQVVHDDFSGSEHIASLVRNVKPEADASAYFHTVLNSEEPLYGAHGTFVERRRESTHEYLAEDRKELIQRFRKGEISYNETALGACTTVTPCDNKLLRSITACMNCDRAVIKISKFDRVIARQELFVSQLEEMHGDSVEVRTEREELSTLRDFKNNLKARSIS